MSEKLYQNREIDEKFEILHEKLDLILAQTTKTNGRVSSLEIWRAGIVSVIFVGAFAIPLLVKVFIK